MHSLTSEERRLSREAAIELGVSRVLLFRDGNWICDPRDRTRPDMEMGFGSTSRAAVLDCAEKNK